MSEHRDDPELTAWALGEPVDPPGDEQAGSERARVEHAAAFVREVLRSDDIPALDAAQRLEIMRRADRRAWRRARTMLLVACVGILPVASVLCFTVLRPAEDRALVAEQAKAAAKVRAYQA